METPAEYGDQETKPCPQMAGAEVTPDQCMQCGGKCDVQREVPKHLLPELAAEESPAEEPSAKDPDDMSHLDLLGTAQPPQGPNFEKALKAWGADMPEWVAELAHACDESSQSAVARRLGVSGPAVNQVIHRKGANTEDCRIAKAVRKVLIKEPLSDPAPAEAPAIPEAIPPASAALQASADSVLRRLAQDMREASRAFDNASRALLELVKQEDR